MDVVQRSVRSGTLASLPQGPETLARVFRGDRGAVQQGSPDQGRPTGAQGPIPQGPMGPQEPMAPKGQPMGHGPVSVGDVVMASMDTFPFFFSRLAVVGETTLVVV